VESSASSTIHEFRCSEAQEQRLDRFLLAQLPEYSRARLQALIADGLVTVDGNPARKSGQGVAKGSTVRVVIPPPAPARAEAEAIPLEVVFENDDAIVINKPAGMVVHPAAGHRTGTLVNAALGYAPGMQAVGGEERPGIVHRLDKDTSGLIVLAKNDSAHHWLQEQFRQRKAEKTYLALVDGEPPTPAGRVEAAIGRDPSHRQRMAVVRSEKGREAITEYRVLERFAKHTLLECHPLTGRTHQIRLHCAFLGSPVVGDTVYGLRKPSLPIGRHFLHAAKLALMLPHEPDARSFEAALPPDLEQILVTLRSERGRQSR
jgi:23S rRNA pseudouridine1911/1915/1917 synthase